ncbi:MAG: hypothetical protein U0L11_05125 [Acutalibacteraceae bacterium]|nr:hypothetical protein [Acutalibacteraceae bacterium]
MIRFVPFETEEFAGMIALDSEEKEIGRCTFLLNGYQMKFISVDCKDDIITEGLARAAMNYAANRYAYIAEINKDISSPAFSRLGFSGEDVLRVEIPEALMSSGCNCGNAN